MTINKLTDDRLSEILKNMQDYAKRDGQLSEFVAGCAAIGRVDPTFIDCVSALEELQEYRKAEGLALPNTEQIYQCEFCHHDANGDLQWHWEDVNKEFYEQYDFGRRGKRRVLYNVL